MRYTLLLFFLLAISCNSAKNKSESNSSRIIYDESKKVTYITSNVAIDTITLPGHWNEISKLKNGNRINYHFYGLENIDDKQQIEFVIGLYKKSGYYVQGTSIRTYTRQMAQHKVGIAELNNTPIKQHVTDNDTFYTFSLTENNLFRYHLKGGRGEFQYTIHLYPSIVNEEKNLTYLIDLFKKIKP